MNKAEGIKEHYELLNHNPATFVEQLYGIKLFPYQRVIFNLMYKAKQISYRHNPYYKYQKYMRLCFVYINMKDDAKIVISSPDGDTVMNKEEFGEWLESKYWR